MSRFVLLLAAGFLSICITDSLHAQRRIPYSSRRPTVSPWVTLGPSTNGGVNNYLGMIRPRQQLVEFADQQMQFTESQRALDRQAGYELYRLERALEEGIQEQVMLQQRPTSARRAAARAGTFMNYSRFYPGAAGAGGSRFMSR